VVVAGGKRLDSVRDALALASDAVTAGAAGIDFGRNVWQSDDPVATIQALGAVVHHGHGVDDALGLYERLAGRPVPAGR
jgi:3-hydroxy-5-phosphonooxypentane-2,4-dione thiolase